MKMEFGACEGMQKAAVTPEEEQEEKESWCWQNGVTQLRIAFKKSHYPIISPAWILSLGFLLIVLTWFLTSIK